MLHVLAAHNDAGHPESLHCKHEGLRIPFADRRRIGEQAVCRMRGTVVVLVVGDVPHEPVMHGEHLRRCVGLRVHPVACPCRAVGEQLLVLGDLAGGEAILCREGAHDAVLVV